MRTRRSSEGTPPEVEGAPPEGEDGPSSPARMPSRERRRQLLRVASCILSEQGIDRVRIPHVAEAAGVTRAVVYRFFPSRQALLGAILEEFRADIEARFERYGPLLRTNQVTDAVVRSFVEAACESIDELGPGGWHLIGMRGPDPDLAALAEANRLRLYEPWLTRVAHVTRVPDRLVPAVSEMVIAASRAVMRLYIEGRLSRDEAGLVLSRGVKALLGEFSVP